MLSFDACTTKPIAPAIAVTAATTPHTGTAKEPIVIAVVVRILPTEDAAAPTLPTIPVNPLIALLTPSIFCIIFAPKAAARATPMALISGLKTGILFSRIFRISTTLDRPS